MVTFDLIVKRPDNILYYRVSFDCCEMSQHQLSTFQFYPTITESKSHPP